MSNDALVGYAAGKAVMDKVNGDHHNAQEISSAKHDAALANQRANSAKDTTAGVVGIVISLKTQLNEARALTADWKKCAFRERVGKLTWIKTIKDLIKYKHLDKTYEEIRDHSLKYYDANLEDNYKLMDVKNKNNMDIEIKGDFPLL